MLKQLASLYLIGKLIRRHNHDPRTELVVIKFCGLMGFSLAMIHAFASFTLLTPAYFAKYFAADGRLNLQGEIAVFAGVIALWALALPAITTLPMIGPLNRWHSMETQPTDGVWPWPLEITSNNVALSRKSLRYAILLMG